MSSVLSRAARRSRGRSLLLPIVVLAVLLGGAAVVFLLSDATPSQDDGLDAPQSLISQGGDGKSMQLDPTGERPRGPRGATERLDTPPRDPQAGGEADAPASELAIMGRVVDARGTGLADVDVSLYDALGDFLVVVSSDPDPFADSADPNSTAPAVYRHDKAWRPGDAPVEVELLVDRAPRLEGRVTLASTGEPVFMADIEIVVGGAAFVDDYQDEWTDELGNFSISLIEIPPKGLLVRVIDDDALAIVGPFDLQPGEVKWLDIELYDPVSVRGLVFDANDGSPLPDVEVNVLPLHPVFDTSNDWDVTFDDGSFELEDVSMPSNRIWLLASDMEHGPELVQVTRPDLPVEIRMGPLVNLSGSVLDAISGEPVEDFELRVVLLGPGGANDDYEDLGWPEDDGSFDFELEFVPASAALLIVEADGYLTVRAPMSDYAPTNKALYEYEFDIPLQPSGEG